MLKKNLSLSDVELKFKADGAGSFEGYGSVYGKLDSHGDIIVKGAYGELVERIKGGVEVMPKMFVNHDWLMGNLPVGKYKHIEEDGHGLLLAGEFTPGNARAVEARASMQHGTVDGLSVGIPSSAITAEKTKQGDRTVNMIKNVSKLMEVSIVTFPSNGDARVDLTSVKSALEEINSIRDFEMFLRDEAGFSRATAEALAMRCKGIFARGEPDVIELPSDVAGMIARNLELSKSL